VPSEATTTGAGESTNHIHSLRWVCRGDQLLIVDVLLLLGGVVLVVFSADRMVVASADLAARWGVSAVIVGAVIIGFGSSLPEMMVSILALDQPNGLDLAIGNAVGSNIANISLILAVAVIVFPFGGQSEVIRKEGVLMVVSFLAAGFFLWDGVLHVYEGAILLSGLALAGVAVVAWSRGNGSDVPPDPASQPVWRGLLVALVSLVVLIVGARAMVLGAESIALELGISEGVVGLTILALGTSLPELGAVIASARRGRGDLVLGNVLGSNVFNSLGVIGGVGVLGPGVLIADFQPDLLVMIAVALLAGAVASSGDRLRRIEGFVLLAAYPLAIILAL
jgi:cation:H+ antiporter